VALAVGCSSSPVSGDAPGPRTGLAPATATPKPRPPLDPSYRTLDASYTYYAIASIDELRDHYLVTFHHVEAAYCNFGVSVATGAITGGCGFPATMLGEDRVPHDRRDALPALRAEVRRRKPGASNIRAEFVGRNRLVVLDELRPCDFASRGRVHGHDYTRLELELDSGLTGLLGIGRGAGSNCGAAFCYWCAPEPRWLPLRTTDPLIGPLASGARRGVSAELLAAIIEVLAEPDKEWPPPG
jgi:hypothetical protein